jgi:hypothetical protein
MDLHNPEALAHALLALENLLSVGAIDKYNEYATEWDVIGGLSKLTSLMQHSNTTISERAKKIMDTYFYVPSKEEYQVEEKNARNN